MTAAAETVPGAAAAAPDARTRGGAAQAFAAALWLGFVANGAVVVWLWLHGGGVSQVHGSADLFTSLGRVTGLVGTYLALIQVLLLARLPWLERLVGFDRLTVWHRRNGKACIYLVVAHAVLITVGLRPSRPGRRARRSSRRLLLDSYPGMVTATVGTVLMVVIVVSSMSSSGAGCPTRPGTPCIFAIYAGIALAYLHQLPTGNEFAARTLAQRDYWIALYVVTLALLVVLSGRASSCPGPPPPAARRAR